MRSPVPALIAVAVILSVVGIAAYSTRSNPTEAAPAIVSAPVPAPTPVKGWKTVATRSFAMTPNSKARWDVPYKGKVRIAVSSESPVSFKLDISECGAADVLDAIEECNITSTPFATLLLADTRDPGFSLGKALIGMKSRNPKLSNSIATTRTTVELLRWECIANCSPEAR